MTNTSNVTPWDSAFIKENGWWAVVPAGIAGTALPGEGTTLEEAITDCIRIMREYAADWVDHLSFAPNHALNAFLVQRILTSSDADLRAALIAGSE